MASDSKRAKLVAEITELRKQQMESMIKATFGGWTRDQMAAHDERAERLRRLTRELEALDETSVKRDKS